MSPGAPPVCLAGTPLGDARHVCSFFGSDDEEYRVLLPFVRDGFDCGDRAVHVVGPHQRDIEFESRVNVVWRRHDDAVVCTYPLGRLGGGALLDVVRTHPLVIVGGSLQRNPYFVPPERFLPELRERRAKRATHPPDAL